MKRFISLLCFLSLIICATIEGNAQLQINEYSVSNLDGFQDNYGKYEDWIEIQNTGSAAVNINGYYLSDNPSNPLKWQIPGDVVIPAGGYKIVWVSGRNEVSNNHVHAEFKLSQTKDEPESILLSDPNGQLLDQVQLEVTMKEHARGRAAFGTGWKVFTSPTPGTANGGPSYENYAAKATMNVPAGFYLGSVTVELSTTQANATIRYTTNGSEPTASSAIYSSPITINETTILIAKVFSNDPSYHPSLLTFNTYFINVTHTMPVISASAGQLTQLLNGNQSLRPYGTFEYFNASGQRTTIGYGEFNEHGQDSWVHDQRSIDYVSRDECGYNYAIREPIIPITDRDEFQRIILRAAGDDNYPGIDSSALLRDMFVQNIAEINNMNLDVRKGEKCVMYANGQYWGVYGMREKVDDHDFTEYYYGQDKYNLYFLKLWGGTWAEYGGDAAFSDWYQVRDYIKNNDMSVQENFEYVKARYDYTSLIDYIIINSFVVCSDWINWNVGWWKGLNPEGGHTRWGYILWDEDATFNHYINYTGVPGTHPTVSPCYPQNLTADPGQHIVVLNRLRNNPEFNQYYISRYIDLYNTAFKPENMIGYLNEIVDKMAPEMPRHIQRWGGSMFEWENNVQKIRNFINTRYAYLPTGLANCYNLNGPYNFEVNVQPAGAGFVQLNSLELDQYPWEGDYFGGVSMKLKATPLDSNYEFDRWELVNHTAFPNNNVDEITLFPENSEQILAKFKLKTFNDSLVINEINYNSIASFDPEDWIELYNPHEYDLDASGWVFKDEDDTHIFALPEGTIIEAHGYLVLARDLGMFSALFPEVSNVIGDIGFGFSGSGELLRLYNPSGALVDFVEYDDKAPWPTEPDGEGATLELINPELDNSLAESWMASPEHGTPGTMNSQLVGIENPNERAVLKLSLLPNPMHDYTILTIAADGKNSSFRLEVFNQLGEMVMIREMSNETSFVFSKTSLSSGLYVIKVSDYKGNKAVSRLLVK